MLSSLLDLGLQHLLAMYLSSWSHYQSMIACDEISLCWCLRLHHTFLNINIRLAMKLFPIRKSFIYEIALTIQMAVLHVLFPLPPWHTLLGGEDSPDKSHRRVKHWSSCEALAPATILLPVVFCAFYLLFTIVKQPYYHISCLQLQQRNEAARRQERLTLKWAC